ncbi:MAG: serine/threonine-protein kinase, partial [Acidimicrobiia bacterium]
MRVPGVADLAGVVLAGRYRLLGPIGTGASGRVYAGWDTRLRRRVAAKVLHPALAEDAGFLRRFRAEAQLAASLHHPHVVTVFDWGPEPDDGGGGDLPFIVLELLAGGSLRGLLDAGGRLSVAQAAQLGSQAASALAYAHGRGLVHRDVKPANLLFDERGAVKVADFGLVRALAEASWTEPAGAVLGTVRYAAPEQARGATDGRSDQYSLTLVLIEAVTGTVPLAADTSLSTLMVRVDSDVVAPAQLGPLGPVLERAGRADPARRWPDAQRFGAELARAAGSLAPPEPITLPGMAPSADHDPDPTQLRTPPRPGPASLPTTYIPPSPPATRDGGGAGAQGTRRAEPHGRD